MNFVADLRLWHLIRCSPIGLNKTLSDWSVPFELFSKWVTRNSSRLVHRVTGDWCILSICVTGNM